MAKGASVGVSVGVPVLVAVSVGLGVTVAVGVVVLVGVAVSVIVLLGLLVWLVVGMLSTGELQAASKHTVTNTTQTLTTVNLLGNDSQRSDGKKGVMIADFPFG